MSTAAQIAANQANAKQSTGPKTEEGKATSAQNNFRHGLSGAFIIQSWENADDYFQFLFDLRAEHQPATPTEALLVERMAQHWWLGQRALRLQEVCFHEKGPLLNPAFDKELPLYLRYQATHERAFSKCLNDLMKLRAAKRQEQRGFESQNRQAAAETRRQEMHEAKIATHQTKTKPAEPKAADQTTTAATNFSLDAPLWVRDLFAADAAREAELQAFLKTQAA